MKQVTKRAVVVECENKTQAEVLKEKLTNDLGEKYVIQAPRKKKLKIKIFDDDKEECEKEKNSGKKLNSRMDSQRIVYKEK